MRVKQIELFTFEELDDDAKETARDYARDNWHDLAQHYVDDMIASLTALQKEVGGKLDYSLSVVPDRGEFCELKDFNEEKLKELVKKKDDCPLTGVCYDIDIIEALANGELSSAVLKTLHAEGEYTYSDKGLDEMFIANEYEFTKEGKFYNGKA